MADIREKAGGILSEVSHLGQEIRSVNDEGSDNDEFTRLTARVTHSSLVKDSSSGDPKRNKRTTCNEFVHLCSQQLGANYNLGRFDIEKQLPGIGKAYAWIKPCPDVKPRFGVILRHSVFHMDVTIGFDGLVLLRAVSGAGWAQI